MSQNLFKGYNLRNFNLFLLVMCTIFIFIIVHLLGSVEPLHKKILNQELLIGKLERGIVACNKQMTWVDDELKSVNRVLKKIIPKKKINNKIESYLLPNGQIVINGPDELKVCDNDLSLEECIDN